MVKKTLVLYVFHEYNDRVDIFLNNAIFKDDNLHFMIICNNLDLESKIPIHLKSILLNLDVKIIVRENIGYDFGGWSYGLLTNELYKEYDYFIFANSSIIGPYMSSYPNNKWTNIFINGLDNEVKLFGCTINTLNDAIHRSHIQSYLFSMNQETLKYLIDCEIFSLTNIAQTFGDAVWNKEVLMSRKIIEKGWNIGCTCKKLNGVDYTFNKIPFHEIGFEFHADVTKYEFYLGQYWIPSEVIFIKGNKWSVKEEDLNIFKRS
jgi:lipopolysaccharide biosynthesis protein